MQTTADKNEQHKAKQVVIWANNSLTDRQLRGANEESKYFLCSSALHSNYQTHKQAIQKICSDSRE
jgi:hypothetical protein